MKYTNSNQWYQEYGKEVMDKNEFSEFEKYLNDIRRNGSHTLDEWEDLYDDFLKDSKKSVRKSMKESRVDRNAVIFEFTCLLNRLGYSGVDYSNEENNEKCDDIVYMIMDLLKTMPRL